MNMSTAPSTMSNSNVGRNRYTSGTRRKKLKGRSEQGSFLLIPHHILKSDEFGSLRSWAAKLLIELAKEYKGSNNGDFSATFPTLKKRGWNSPGTLSTALAELQAAGWILKTRQGGRNCCSLYAVTWWALDDCAGKHDYAAETVARHDWKKNSSRHEYRR